MGVHTAKLMYLNSVRLSFAHCIIISFRSVSLWISIICCAAMLKFCHGVVVMYCAVWRSLKKNTLRVSVGFRCGGSGVVGEVVTCGSEGDFDIESIRREARERGLCIVATV